MIWIKSNWRWAVLNLSALFMLVIMLGQGSTEWNATHTFDPMLESGKWAIRFLLLSLAMTPLRTYLGWNGAIKLRKPAGLWSFGFAAVHVGYYVYDAKLSWLALSMPSFLALGLVGLLILVALAATSNRWAMRRLGKHWKRLHRLVYLAAGAVVLHAILATTMSKKIQVRDPQAIHELQIYLALLAVLLVVRIPLVRRMMQRGMVPPRRQPRAQPPISPVRVPGRMLPPGQVVFERESRFRLNDATPEKPPEEETEKQPVIPSRG